MNTLLDLPRFLFRLPRQARLALVLGAFSLLAACAGNEETYDAVQDLPVPTQAYLDRSIQLRSYTPEQLDEIAPRNQDDEARETESEADASAAAENSPEQRGETAE